MLSSPLSGSSVSPWIDGGATYPSDDALESSLHCAAFDLCTLSCYDCDLSSEDVEIASASDGLEIENDNFLSD